MLVDIKISEKKEKALIDAIACLSELKKYELFPVSQETIDGLTEILGYTPDIKSDQVIYKEPLSFESAGTFSDSYMHE